MSSEDLTQAVQTAFSSFDRAKGKRFIVQGKEELTLKELLHHIEQSVGRSQGETKLTNSLLRLDLSDYIEEFFVGITHDKNMRRMAEYFDTQRPDITQHEGDFFSEFNLSHQKTVSDVYGSNHKIREEELVHPIFTNYKMTSLD